MRTALWTILTLLVATSCGNNGTHDIPVPRRTAYYRLDLPSPHYRQVTLQGNLLEINSAIDSVELNGDGWLTVNYPHNIASIYITATPLTAATAHDIIDNRIERLSMNTGGAPTEVTQIDIQANYDARIIVTPHDSPTPVQFIATDHNTLLLTGTAAVPHAAASPNDSMAPVIEMLKRDITHLLMALK